MQKLAALVTLKVHVTCLVTTTVVSSQEPIIQMMSLMHPGEQESLTQISVTHHV